MQLSYIIILSLVMVSCKETTTKSKLLNKKKKIKIAKSNNEDNNSQNNSTEFIAPEKIVLPFKLSSCPTGWEAFNPLKGRLAIGAGSGNLDGEGNALTSRNFGDWSGLEYTNSLPATTGNATLSQAEGNIFASSAFNAFTEGYSTCLSGTNCAKGNLPPYVSYTYCEISVNPDLETLASGAVIHSESSCAGSWTTDVTSKGRYIVGAGSGNNDSDGNPISTYSFGETGGKEITNSIRANTSSADGNQAGSNVYLASSIDIYQTGAPDNSMYGDGAQGNMSPYYALNNCTNNASIDGEFPSGTIAAFNDSACPEGWSPYDHLAGRSPLATGSGNNDRDGVALTNRTLGDNGGYEWTSGLPISTSIANIDEPGPTIYIANTNGSNLYAPSSQFGTRLSGNSYQGNMSPFYVLKFCKKD